MAVPEEKACDALLYFFKIACCLGDAEHQTAGSHRMHGHRGGRHDHGEICADGERNADGVSAAQHQRNGGSPHTGDHLSDRKTGFHITAHGVQQDQQSLNAAVLLNGDQRR